MINEANIKLNYIKMYYILHLINYYAFFIIIIIVCLFKINNNKW